MRIILRGGCGDKGGRGAGRSGKTCCCVKRVIQTYSKLWVVVRMVKGLDLDETYSVQAALKSLTALSDFLNPHTRPGLGPPHSRVERYNAQTSA